MASQNIHNIVVAGRRTSVRLEPAMWEALRKIAGRQGRSIHEIATEIRRERPITKLTAAIRGYIVESLQETLLSVESDRHQGAAGSRTLAHERRLGLRDRRSGSDRRTDMPDRRQNDPLSYAHVGRRRISLPVRRAAAADRRVAVHDRRNGVGDRRAYW